MNQILKEKIIFYIVILLSGVFLIWYLPFFLFGLISFFLTKETFWNIMLPFGYILLYIFSFGLSWFFVKNSKSKIPERIFYLAIFLFLICWNISWITHNFFPKLEQWVEINYLYIDLCIGFIFSFGLGFPFAGLLKKSRFLKNKKTKLEK